MYKEGLFDNKNYKKIIYKLDLKNENLWDKLKKKLNIKKKKAKILNF